MKPFKSLRALLIIWYIGSLFILSAFFYLVIHILQLPHGTEFFIILIILSALIGLLITFWITRSLSYLSHRIKSITSENLGERITDIKGENEIGELAKSFNSLLDRIDEAFKRERQFIADVAHELKTPSATLQSGIEIALSKERSKDEYKKTLEEALIDAKRQTKMLNNVLDLAWLEAGNKQLKTGKINLSGILEELHEIVFKLAVQKDIKIEKNIEENIIILGSKDKLARALLNILDNAIKYTPRKGNIRITLIKKHDHAEIKVSDNGSGISRKDLPHIYERFYRGSTTDKIHGSGLGLSIAKSVVHLHNGVIKAESELHKGTTFTIILPLSHPSS